MSASKLNLLVAYPYLKESVVESLRQGGEDIRLVVDSGAFTAWKAGKPIALDDYCRFLEALPVKPWRYFTLDVIGDPDGSLVNYDKMLQRGFKPIPIFTRGEDVAMIDEYYKTSDVVGIGGLVGTKGNKGFVNGIMRAVGNRKVHWLGFTNLDYMKHYKPFMCDSSGWSSSFRYASAKVYAGNGAWKSFTKQDLQGRPSDALLALIRSHGVDPARLARMDEWSNGNREKEFAIETLTHRTWVKYQADVERNLGTKFFLACSTDGQVRLMHRAYQHWRSF